MSIGRLIKSFKYAFSGILHTIKTEQNMRIHLVIANLIILFAYFFGITRIEWAVLFLTIGFVIFAEMVNTAIERMSDAVTKEYNINIKYAKDVAAAGVTIAAIVAVFVGIALFGDFVKIISTVTYIFTSSDALLVFLVLFIIDILFLFKTRKK